MKMSFLGAGKRLDRWEQLFPACGTRLWPPAELIPHVLTSRYGGSAHPHKLAGSACESCSPSPAVGQHLEMMSGVMDELPCPHPSPHPMGSHAGKSGMCWGVRGMSKEGVSRSQGEMVPGDPSPGSGHHPQHLLQVLQVATPLHICMIANLFLLLLLFFAWLP